MTYLCKTVSCEVTLRPPNYLIVLKLYVNHWHKFCRICRVVIGGTDGTTVPLHSGVARNLQRGWPGVRVPTVGRAAAAGRPKARSAVGRPGGGWVREGSLPPVKGVRGCYPRENFEIVYSKLCILVHFFNVFELLDTGSSVLQKCLKWSRTVFF